MPHDSFSFKQFTVTQSPHAGMKVGTDGVLLGAWCAVDGSQKRVLDVGAGTGIIALMLAQRTAPDALIDALDIDPLAIEQAVANVDASPWAARIRVVDRSLQAWAAARAYPRRGAQSLAPLGGVGFWGQRPSLYDHIVSNPPYFTSELRSPSLARATARHAVTLSHEDMLASVDVLLSAHGRFSVILPTDQAASLRVEAAGHNLTATRLTDIYARHGSPCKRVLTEFMRPAQAAMNKLVHDTLTIASPDGDGFSDEYMALTRDFYIKF